MSLACLDRASRNPITRCERDHATQFLHDALAVADRVNQALGQPDLTPTALRVETPDLFALQQLALLYAEQALSKSDWINLHGYVAQLAATEGTRCLWQWQWHAMDLMAFALNDYLADRPSAGDTLLHDLAALTRQGAADRVHDAYRRWGRDHFASIRAERAADGTLDALCTTVVARRRRPDAQDR